MILKEITTAGKNWAQSSKTDRCWHSICVTPTGRIIAGSDRFIWYSDDNGINWTRSNTPDTAWPSLCVTPTGRIIAGGSSEAVAIAGIWYSDDNGTKWTLSDTTDELWECLCITPTGRIVAGTKSTGILYSDDSGINWVQSNKTDGYWSSICVTPTGRIIAGSGWYNRVSVGIWYSDPEYTAVNPKYLDQNGAKEIVTQFKAYCDSLVGGV